VSVLALSGTQTLLELHSRITAVSLLDPILTSKLDLDLCKVIEEHDLGVGVISGLELVTLPQGSQLRQDIIER